MKVELNYQRFAELALAAKQLREKSWDEKRNCYDLSFHDAVTAVLAQEEVATYWHWPIYMIIVDGYCECDEWIEKPYEVHGED